MTYSSSALAIGQKIAGIVVEHTHFKEAINAIGRAIQVGNAIDIFAGICLIAPSGYGKSLVIECVRKNVLQWPQFDSASVLFASLKETPTVAQIQGDLLRELHYAITPKATLKTNAAMNELLVSAIKQSRIRLIALDEFQHIFLARGDVISHPVNDWLKRLMNLTGIPVLVSGTERLAAISNSDPQLATRIPTVVRLPVFKYDAEWLGFLKAFCQKVQEVDLSILPDRFGREIFVACAGVPRLFKLLAIEGAMIAFDAKCGSLEESHLRIAFFRVFGNCSPQENPFQ